MLLGINGWLLRSLLLKAVPARVLHKMPKRMHNPGSADAIAGGCTCDLIKNDFGRGKSDSKGIAFYCEAACPMHGSLKAFASLVPKMEEAKAALKWLSMRVNRRPL